MKKLLIGLTLFFVASESLYGVYDNLNRFLPNDSKLKLMGAKNPRGWFSSTEVAYSCDDLDKSLNIIKKVYECIESTEYAKLADTEAIEKNKIAFLNALADSRILNAEKVALAVNKILVNESSEVRAEETKKFIAAQLEPINKLLNKSSVIRNIEIVKFLKIECERIEKRIAVWGEFNRAIENYNRRSSGWPN